MYRTIKSWLEQYVACGALWHHSGNSNHPHAELTSGFHSDSYCNSELVLENSVLADEASADLVECLWNAVKPKDVDRVVGPAMGAIRLAQCVARVVTRWQWERERPCLSAYTVETVAAGGKVRIFEKTRVLPGERVLLVEDAATTFGSLQLTADAVTALGGIVLPYIGVLVNHSTLSEVGGRRVISLLDFPLPTWTPGECPLCRQGSEAIRPKGSENWQRLTAARR